MQVYVSYWIQAAIALLGFIATSLWGPWVYFMYYKILSIQYGHERATQRSRWVRSVSLKRLSRLAVALVDFQKAQCFFMLATNTAAQVVVWRGGFKPTSLQQLYNTYTFVRVLAVSGYLPITFTLFTLHLIGMVSWYILLLSFLSVASSIITLRAIGSFQPGSEDMKDLNEWYSSGGPETCGNSRLDTFCFIPIDYSSGYQGPGSPAPESLGHSTSQTLAFCLVVLVLLLVQQSKILGWRITQQITQRILNQHGVIGRKLLQRVESSWQRNFDSYASQRVRYWILTLWDACLATLASLGATMRWRLSTQPLLHQYSRSLIQKISSMNKSDRCIMIKKTISRYFSKGLAKAKHYHYSGRYFRDFREFLVISLYIVFSVLYIYWFSAFLQDLGWFASSGSYSKTWNFGQVVAITVFAPPLCEYIYLELRE